MSSPHPSASRSGNSVSVAAIDWTTWTPTDRATLVFIVRADQVLLIRKKRGLGAGKINGPGGRLDPGETPLACAIREVEEEVGTTPLQLAELGELRFQFLDGYSIHVHVFRADGLTREPRETAEAVPLWSSRDALPYDEMWADDRIWLPWLLERRPFDGRFVFDGDRMLDQVLTPHARLGVPSRVPRGGDVFRATR